MKGEVNTMIFHTARKYRIYPNPIQKGIIDRTLGACRFIYNKFIEVLCKHYERDEPLRVPTNYSWIDEDWLFDRSIIIDRGSFSRVWSDVKSAISKYYDKIRDNKGNIKFRKDGKPRGFPRFKSKKHDKDSYSDYISIDRLFVDYSNHQIKLHRLGMVDFDKREKPIPSDWKMKHYTISRKAGKYYCSICFEYENRFIHKGLNCIQIDDASKYIGLDYKSDGLYIDSNGQCAEYPKYYRQSQRKLRTLQKKYSRQQKGGKNREKTRLKIQQLHDHISNQRKDLLHKLSTAITKQYDVICVEDIDMRAMSQCLHLGKSTLDNGFGMFRDMLIYKALRQPMKYLVKVGRFFASSKTCSFCGYKLDELKLSDRVFYCPRCKHSIDRDFNAAINIRDEGFRIIKEEMHGYYER